MNGPVDTCFVPPTLGDILRAPSEITLERDDEEKKFVQDKEMRSSKLLWWVGFLASAGVAGGVIERFLADMQEACHLHDCMKVEISDLTIRSKSLHAQVEKLCELRDVK